MQNIRLLDIIQLVSPRIHFPVQGSRQNKPRALPSLLLLTASGPSPADWVPTILAIVGGSSRPPNPKGRLLLQVAALLLPDTLRHLAPLPNGGPLNLLRQRFLAIYTAVE